MILAPQTRVCSWVLIYSETKRTFNAGVDTTRSNQKGQVQALEFLHNPSRWTLPSCTYTGTDSITNIESEHGHNVFLTVNV